MALEISPNRVIVSDENGNTFLDTSSNIQPIVLVLKYSSTTSITTGTAGTTANINDIVLNNFDAANFSHAEIWHIGYGYSGAVSVNKSTGTNFSLCDFTSNASSISKQILLSVNIVKVPSGAYVIRTSVQNLSNTLGGAVSSLIDPVYISYTVSIYSYKKP
jgi:hypothetical protein